MLVNDIWLNVQHHLPSVGVNVKSKYEIMKKKKRLEHQMFDRWVVRPIDPVSQRIILKIVRFYDSAMHNNHISLASMLTNTLFLDLKKIITSLFLKYKINAHFSLSNEQNKYSLPFF